VASSNLTLHSEDLTRFESLLGRLRDEANAKLVFLLDKNGQQIAGSGGFGEVDSTALASLTAGNVAATEGLSRLIGETGFTSMSHEGNQESLHITLISQRVILLVVYDEKSSLGLVRLRVQQSAAGLTTIVDDILKRADQPLNLAGSTGSPICEITDEDIDALFG
jgi:predicted regulator of Ras-like GTPase activity (Roadblock/LC7/MglB family)